jgi:hypothetical protein
MIRTLIALAVLLATGCGAGPEGSGAVAPQPLDLSVDARKEAVIEAASLQFKQSIKDTFLAQGMTVRGLARAVTHSSKTIATKSPADFHASHYDPAAKSSAKIEVINGKIIYTAVAAATSQTAAVIADEKNSYRISYEIEAAVTPDGELKDFEFRELGVATRELN